MKLVAVGDIAFDFKTVEHPFNLVLSFLKDKEDLLFGNLETTLSDKKGHPQEKRWLFKAPKSYVRFLKETGFDVLNLANNHILDFGYDRLMDTLDTLDEHGIKYIGVGRDLREAFEPRILSKAGLEVAFLGYYSGGNTMDSRTKGPVVAGIEKREIIHQLRKLRAQGVDKIIVSLHWGVEKTYYPLPCQQKLARDLVNNGATIILGHGPHLVQGFEKHNNGIIAYSLGNFQIAFRKGEGTDRSIIGRFNIHPDSIEFDFVPIKINQDFCPELLIGKEKNKLIKKINMCSYIIGQGLRTGFVLEQICGKHLKDSVESYIILIKRYGFRYALKFIKWLISPFCLKCYASIVKKKFKEIMIKI